MAQKISKEKWATIDHIYRYITKDHYDLSLMFGIKQGTIYSHFYYKYEVENVRNKILLYKRLKYKPYTE